MRQFLFTIFLVNFFSTPFVYAVDRIDFSAGNITRPANTTPIVNSFRAGATWNTDHLEFENDFLHQSLRIEASVGLNQTKAGEVRDLALSPVLHYQLKKPNWPDFFEIGVGITHISETHWKPYNDMGSHLLFADRIGAGYYVSTTEVSINFFHISNGGLATPNPGADMLLVRASFKL